MVPSPATSPSLEHVDLAELEGFTFPDGKGFPPSYREFIRTHGWARTFGLWLIYPPVRPGFADGRARAQNLTARFRESYSDGRHEGYDWMVSPDGDWELITRLDVFGWSENGDVLLWDVASRDSNDEFPIWESRGMNTLNHLGASLADALPRMREGSGDGTIEPLEPHRL